MAIFSGLLDRGAVIKYPLCKWLLIKLKGHMIKYWILKLLQKVKKLCTFISNWDFTLKKDVRKFTKLQMLHSFLILGGSLLAFHGWLSKKDSTLNYDFFYNYHHGLD